MERGMVSDKHHATSFSLKKWTGPMGKAANKWFTWNVDGAWGNIDTGFPSTFQFLSLCRYNLQMFGGFESSCTSSTHYHGQLYWAWIYEHLVLKPACVAVFPLEFSYLQMKKAGTGVGTYGKLPILLFATMYTAPLRHSVSINNNAQRTGPISGWVIIVIGQW